MANRITITINEKGEITKTFGNIKEVTGYELDEFIGKNVDIIIPNELKDKHHEGHGRWRKHGTKSAMGTWIGMPMLRKDESVIDIKMCLTESDGNVTALITTDPKEDMDPGQMLDTIEKNQILEKELRMAQEIQTSMLPLTFPKLEDITNLSIGASMKPAKMVGGDFYDFGVVDSSHYFIVVGDISGKGVSAALFMAIVKTILRSNVMTGMSACDTLSKINEELTKSNSELMFATVWLGIINVDTGVLEYSNAGHNAPLLMINEQVTELDEVHGPPVGIMKSISYSSNKAQLNTLDSLIVYSDGVVEAMNLKNEQYGSPRLHSWAVENHQMIPSQLVAELTRDVLRHSGKREQFDDITILSICYYGPPSLDIRLPSKMSSIRVVFEALDELIHAESLNLIKTAVDDVINNIIQYSGSKTFRLEAGIAKEEYWIRITDDGKAFDPTMKKAPENLDQPPEKREIGGLGIHLVNTLMDRVRYHRKGNKNVLIISKKA